MKNRGKTEHIDDIKTFQPAIWKSLFQALDDNPHAIFLIDQNLHILALNTSAVHFSSLMNDTAVAAGNVFLDAFPPMAHTQLLRAIQPGLQGEISSLDFEFSTDRGLISFNLTFSPLKPAEGQVTSILCVVAEKNQPNLRPSPIPVHQDPLDAQLSGRITSLEETNRHLRLEIEKQLESETALQASETFFRQNFQSLPDPTLIWVKDPEGEIRLAAANRAAGAFTGSRVQELTGLTLEDFYSHALQFIGLVQRAFSADDTRHIELLFTSQLVRGEKWVLCDFIRLSDQYVLNILRDITSEKDRQKIDEDTRNQIELLRQAMTAFTSVLNLEQVLTNILEYLQKLIPHDRAILFLLEGANLVVRATSGFTEGDDLLDMEIPAQNSQFEAINRNRLPIFLANAKEYRPFEALGPLNCGKSWLGVPLLGHGQVLGYLSIYAQTPGKYENEHSRLAEIFSNEASIAIENARLFQQVQQLAVTDELSGYYNRRYFYELVELELARSRRYKHPVSLLMIDLDHFKAVNDRYGHATGDRVLINICNQIRQAVRESDIPGRHGGEEFVLLLPETPFERAIEVAERLCRMIEAHRVVLNGIEISITISIGVAAIGPDCKDSDTLFQQADLAMYQAKLAGRNQVSAAAKPQAR
ncbi:MAG: diguanylate cyclase [Bellilinea sp.]